MKSLFQKRSLEQRASEKRRVVQTLPRSPHPPEAPAPEAAEPSPRQMTARSKADALKALVLTIPEDDPGLARMLVELGELQREAKQHDEAQASLEQALLAAREARDQSMVLIGLNSLGLLLRELGQNDEARALLEEAVEIRRMTQGDRHPETLTALNNLASLLKSIGMLDEAAPLFAEALEARREVLGHAHMDTLTSMNNMASVLRARDQDDDLMAAERLLAEGFGTSRRVLGDGHVTTRYFAANYATTRGMNRNRRGDDL